LESVFLVPLIVFLSTYAFSLAVDVAKTLFEFVLNSRFKDPTETVTFAPEEVGFVIPCHNSEDVIEGTLRTIPRGYPIVCMTNCCTDGTIALLKKLKESRPEIIIGETSRPGKIHAVMLGAAILRDCGFTHFVLLDDDVEWPESEPMVRAYSKACPLTAIPVVPVQSSSWIVNAQAIEYQIMVVSKRAQFSLGNVLMASGAAGIYRIDVFFDTMHYHDGEHVGDDLQYSHIQHTFGRRLDFFLPNVVRTHPPYSLKVWWKQRAKRWEISPIYNWRWVLGSVITRNNGGPGFWIRLTSAYRLFVVANDIARCLSLPMTLYAHPEVVLGVFGITYTSISLKTLVYYLRFRNFAQSFDKWYVFTMLTYPIYGFLTWLSRIVAIPRALHMVHRSLKEGRKSLAEKYKEYLV
jgi:glycosyltransferase involved in cell wall biosynthesis